MTIARSGTSVTISSFASAAWDGMTPILQDASGDASECDDHPVRRALLGDVAAVGKHLRAHVGEDHALGAGGTHPLADARVREVSPDRLAIEVALRDQEIGEIGRASCRERVET